MAQVFAPGDDWPMSDDVVRVYEQTAHSVTSPISLVLSGGSNGDFQVKPSRLICCGDTIGISPSAKQTDQELGRVMHSGVDFSQSIRLPSEQAKQALEFFANNPLSGEISLSRLRL